MAWFDAWYPDRFDKEVAALQAAEIEFEVDQQAKDGGVLRLTLTQATSTGEQVALVAVYPEFYPYFRPEVFAPDREFRRHQNPNSKNLCLLGRGSERWSSEFTLADILPDAFDAIANYDQDGDQQTMQGQEEAQGEPVSDYLNAEGLSGSLALFDSAWSVSPEIMRGWLDIEMESITPPRLIVRRILDEAKNTIIGWEDYPVAEGARRQIPWVRFEGQATGSVEQMKAFVAAHGWRGFQPRQSAASSKHFFAILFREEVLQFAYSDGWALLQTGRHGVGADGLKVIKTFRAGKSDLAARIPSVAALSDKSVAVFGLGAIGSTIAFELVRNGARAVHAIDFDFVEPASVRRWVAGRSAFGELKPDAFKKFVEREYPMTDVVAHNLRIGGVDAAPHNQYEKLTGILDAVDLVVDTSIEAGVNSLLSQMCWAAHKPYVIASGSPGAWGGRVAQFDRQAGHRCWTCYKADLDAHPQKYTVPADPNGEVQPPGCAARTFTGTSFDLAEISMETVRVCCGSLSPAQYPGTPWQLTACDLRDGSGNRIPPTWRTVEIAPREGCTCLAA